MAISQKVTSRITSGLKAFQSVLTTAKQRDISESDTVVIIGDMLSDMLGYDKYQNITTEYAIRGTYVDLAVRVDNRIRFLVEAKAIGVELKDAHVKQAVDYAANEGIDWVVLTNAAEWRIYKVQFSKPIDKTLLCDFDVLSAGPRNAEIIECFGNLSLECFSRGSMTELLEQKQITSKFALAAVLLSDTILDEVRRELRRISPGLKVDVDYLKSVLTNDVIKRDLLESEEGEAAAATIKKLQRALAREKKKTDDGAVEKDLPITTVTAAITQQPNPTVAPAQPVK
ncbi:MAG TPA: type I restriction enzyme HsdR N-terminal domain-containing protein [Pseudolabrys sp.]|nr:type I restriction enzyme HsdR N-terminal domain-containing protein [Pseudolabrys sp.]